MKLVIMNFCLIVKFFLKNPGVYWIVSCGIGQAYGVHKGIQITQFLFIMMFLYPEQ